MAMDEENWYNGHVITWSDYGRVVHHKLYNFYLNQRYVDVTIQCGDCHMRAHGVVLAAGSKFFERALALKRETIGVIGISGDVMGTLLQFLYLGRTAAEDRELDAVLNAAKILEIEGLCEANRADMPREEFLLLGCEDDVRTLVSDLDLKEEDVADVGRTVDRDAGGNAFVMLETGNFTQMAEASRRALRNIKKHAQEGIKNVQDSGLSEADMAAQVIVSEMEGSNIRPPTPPSTMVSLEISHSEYLTQEDSDNFFLQQLPTVARDYESEDESTLAASDLECPRSPDPDPETNVLHSSANEIEMDL